MNIEDSSFSIPNICLFFVAAHFLIMLMLKQKQPSMACANQKCAPIMISQQRKIHVWNSNVHGMNRAHENIFQTEIIWSDVIPCDRSNGMSVRSCCHVTMWRNKHISANAKHFRVAAECTEQQSIHYFSDKWQQSNNLLNRLVFVGGFFLHVLSSLLSVFCRQKKLLIWQNGNRARFFNPLKRCKLHVKKCRIKCLWVCQRSCVLFFLLCKTFVWH